jgi:hypothetical protein
MRMANNASWKKIFEDYRILEHDFNSHPFEINAEQIKIACQDFRTVAQKEVRILCKQDSREDRPQVFAENGLFLLPIKNGIYSIIRGEGYIDIPEIESAVIGYDSMLDFRLDTSEIGNSEMQHLDFAYASSLIRTFINDDSLVLTIRGRKYTPEFSFRVGSQLITAQSVQTEVDAGYEGRNKIVLIEAKNASTKNTINRQLFYPYKQWKQHTQKDVYLLFFEKRGGVFHIWQYGFREENDYNSIYLARSGRYSVNGPNSLI